MSLKDKLEQAGQKAEKQKAERRAKVVKGSHLTEQFRTLATEAGLTVTPSKSGAFLVVTGLAGKARRIYVSTRGGTVDFSGFTVENTDAVTQISEDEAKKMHLGLVRGRINFDAEDAEILSAYTAALALVNVVIEKPAKVKAPKAPRAPRAPKAKVEVAVSTNVAD